jgi:hypothetical protein
MLTGMDDYLAIDRANWDERAPVHAASQGCGVERFSPIPAISARLSGSTCPGWGI